MAQLIETVNICEAFQVLPYDGGLYDQPASLVDKMALVLMIKGEAVELQRKRTR